MLLGIVVDYYHGRLKQSPEAQRYLVKRGLQSAEIVDRFRLGYANRTLGSASAGVEPRRRRGAADAVEGAGHPAQPEAGTSTSTARWSSRCSICAGEVVEMYGRKITTNLRAGTPDHLVSSAARTGACGTKRR